MEINEKVLELKVREAELKEQLAYYEAYPPVNNMGKWARQTAIDRISERLAKVQYLGIVFALGGVLLIAAF